MQEKESGRWKRYGTLTLVLMIALMGSFKYLSGFQTVSSNVNGRELPIYSVETDEKKAALTLTWRGEMKIHRKSWIF